jgi:hypothetical protein
MGWDDRMGEDQMLGMRKIWLGKEDRLIGKEEEEKRRV